MLGKLLKKAAVLPAMVATVWMMGIPVLAAIPNTGDESGALLPIMGGLLAVSVVLVIVYAVMSAKKRK